MAKSKLSIVTPASREEALTMKFAKAKSAELYTLFVDGDASDDPIELRETAASARSCLGTNIAALSRACAAAVSGSVGLSTEDTADCFYGLAQMADILEAITEVHDTATYQCIKRSEGVRHASD